MASSGVLQTPLNFTKTESVVATKYDWVLTSLILHHSIELVIFLYDDLGEVVHQVNRKIEGEEYNNWGTDDSHIENIIQAELDKLMQQ